MVEEYANKQEGCAIVLVVSRRLPITAVRVPPQVMWDLWWTKWHWDRLLLSTSVSLANSHSTKCSILIYHPVLVQYAN
jgi:hypothetical protein